MMALIDAIWVFGVNYKNREEVEEEEHMRTGVG